MYTEPKIVKTDDLQVRAYISFYFNRKRIREYNGNRIGKPIHPNRASSINDRDKELRKLRMEIQTALENNYYSLVTPQKVCTDEVQRTTESTFIVLTTALNKKLASSLSKTYKRNLKYIFNDFIKFLSPEELDGAISAISSQQIEKFLARYNTSATYYMNKRRDLGVLFSSVARATDQTLKAVIKTERQRTKASLHKIYDKEQLHKVLDYLKYSNPNLHLCCLISYGCFLRPHKEVRLLSGSHFKNDFREIHLSGTENKGGKIRMVHVPNYVREELLKRSNSIKYNTNIFSLTDLPFNEAYFSTNWTRAWRKMNKIGIIEQAQTIYSFRHTAAVQVYKKTKDLHILQRLLQHSDMIVTLKYLRGLGELNNEDLKDAAPEL
jgi:site-specific recombinase XerD